MRCPPSSQRWRRSGRSSWCSTTCMPPTSLRSCCCSTWRASCEQSSVLILATHRDWEMHRVPAMRRLLGGLARASQHIPLRGLGEPAVAQFMQMADRGAAPASSLVAAVHQTTGGNPFFLKEVVRVLQARGRVEAAASAAEEPLGVPLRVRETVRRRLELAQRRAAAPCCPWRRWSARSSTASCWRRPAISPRSGCSSSSTRSSPRRRGGASRGPPLRLLARHHPRGALRSDPGRASGRGCTRGSARCSSRAATSDPDAHLDELAHHFGEAAQGGGDPAKAVTYARQAAQQALQHLAFEEAVAHFQHALLALDLDPRGRSRGARRAPPLARRCAAPGWRSRCGA